jgi:hypothetical protein
LNYIILLVLVAALLNFPTEWLTRLKVGKPKKAADEDRGYSSSYDEHDYNKPSKTVSVGRGIISVVFLAIMTWMMLPTISAILMAIVLKAIMAYVEVAAWGRGYSHLRKSAKAIFLVALVLIPLVGGVYYLQVQRVATATYFNGLVTTQLGFPFQKEVPDNMVRLVTEDVAKSFAKAAINGSGLEVKSAHITMYQGRLVWIAVVGSTNTMAQNYVSELIIVDANNPTAKPVIIQKTFNKAEGLWWDHDLAFSAYLADTDNIYGLAYVTPDAQGEMKYVLTQGSFGTDLVTRPMPAMAYDTSGTMTDQFPAMSSVPAWVTQAYDESWMKEAIGRWGDFKRGASFDYWAGGVPWLVAPSNQRIEISEDVRYIVNPDTNELVALVAMHPASSEQALAGMFVISHEGISYYNFEDLNLKSGVRINQLALQNLPYTQPGTSYYTDMALPYRLNVGGNQTRIAWIVPICWTGTTDDKGNPVIGNNLDVKGVRIIDAADQSKVATVLTGEGFVGAAAVHEAKARFANLFGGQITTTGNQTTVTATVKGVNAYVQNGITHVVIRTDNTTYQYLQATPDSIPAAQWQQLLFAQVGDKFTTTIQQVNGVWVITNITFA